MTLTRSVPTESGSWRRRGIHWRSSCHKQALKWYRASSKGGSPAAPFFIALMHIDGIGGVEESDDLARSLLKQSAELGWEPAQEEYAHLCWWGRGGEKRRDISVH